LANLSSIDLRASTQSSSWSNEPLDWSLY